MICGSNQEFNPPFLINQILIHQSIYEDIYIFKSEIQRNNDNSIKEEKSNKS